MSETGLCRAGLGALGLIVGLVTVSPAQAGIPECGNIRLEEVKRCEIRGQLQCTAGCSELGIYKTACATRLHRSCRQECTVSADATCSDHCTTRCKSQCDAGVDITCTHNCFAECSGACDAQCGDAADPAQCRASCEATCDGECDVKCAPLINASCYNHCIECCDGSCTAQANLDCQEVCQDRAFEDCERELRVNCDASCSADGALFCDGRFVMAGSDVPKCVQALLARGTIMVEGQAMGTVTIGPGGTTSSGGFGCGMGGGAGAGTTPWFPAALLVAWLFARLLRQREAQKTNAPLAVHQGRVLQPGRAVISAGRRRSGRRRR